MGYKALHLDYYWWKIKPSLLCLLYYLVNHCVVLLTAVQPSLTQHTQVMPIQKKKNETLIFLEHCSGKKMKYEYEQNNPSELD